MEQLFWYVRVHSGFELTSPYAAALLTAFALYQIHYIVIFSQALVRVLRHGTQAPPLREGRRPDALLVMPTLLRTEAELAGLKKALRSAARNGYPGELTIVAAIDDGVTNPALYAALEEWIASFPAPQGVRVLSTCTKKRTGKAVAIDNGVRFVRAKIAEGSLSGFPPLFFNMDADSELGEHALVRLADRLTTRFPWSEQYPNIVTSNVCIARSEYWRGWRDFFTVRGQLAIHVASDLVLSMLGRHNLKLHLVPGASGALYCTWSKLHLIAPKWGAFMRTLGLGDVLSWWLGGVPPSFTKSTVAELPEAQTGPADDTWMSWLAYCCRWEHGELTVELPRTPLHALWYMLRGYVLRAMQYEPHARVETKTPTTIRALFKQRVRWNTSRIELSQRWIRVLPFHWALFSPMVVSTVVIVYFASVQVLAFVLLPLAAMSGMFAAFCLAYVISTTVRSLAVAFGIALDGGFRRHGYKLLGALAIGGPYALVFHKLTTIWGYVQDVFLFGVNTGFSPEETHIKGGAPRVALAYRIRRAYALCLRALVHNDVPLGWFWLGWNETAWTPSGYEGWTTGKRRVLKPRPPIHREAADAVGHAPAAQGGAPRVPSAVEVADARRAEDLPLETVAFLTRPCRQAPATDAKEAA